MKLLFAQNVNNVLNPWTTTSCLRRALLYTSTLKVEALFSSEAVTPNYRIICHKIAEIYNKTHHHKSAIFVDEITITHTKWYLLSWLAQNLFLITHTLESPFIKFKGYILR